MLSNKQKILLDDLQVLKPEIPSWFKGSVNKKVSVFSLEIQYLHHLACEGLNKKGVVILTPEIEYRLFCELQSIESMQVASCFILAEKLNRDLYKNNWVGFGAEASSLVCFAIGLSNINPIQFHLPFERFIHIGKENRFFSITLEIPFHEEGRVYAYLTDKFTMNNVVSLNDDLSSHFVVLNSNKNEVAAIFNKDKFHDLTYDQMEVVVNHKCLTAINIVRSMDRSFNESIVGPLRKHNATDQFFNAFQWKTMIFEEDCIFSTFKPIKRYLKFKPEDFDELVIYAAMLENKDFSRNKVLWRYVNKVRSNQVDHHNCADLKTILNETRGILVFQEQIILIFQNIAGFSGIESAKLHKAFALRRLDGIEKFHAQFLKQGVERLYAHEILENIWHTIFEIGHWCPSKSHCLTRAMLLNHRAYLKTHFPKQFFAVSKKRTNLYKPLQCAP